MKILKSLKLLGFAVIALHFAGNANAMEVEDEWLPSRYL